jgi:quercetin dioxygenase-like cupin family protein
MAPDMVVHDVQTEDERLWAPVAPGIWSRPLHLNVTGGFYVHLLKVKRSGLLQRHRHSGQVHAHVLRGKWLYLEHDWVAEEGSYVFEPPGETHTLVVPDDCQDMVTMFTVHGALMYVDTQGNSTGYDDVFTRIEKYRAHFEAVGLGADYVTTFMRGSLQSATKKPPRRRFFGWCRVETQSGFLIQLAISPMMPRRNANTQTTKITPCMMVTQAPNWAK